MRRLTETIKKNVAYSQQWRCKTCEVLLPPSYQIDHIVPHSILEDDSIGNLQALCPTCHANKTQMEQARIIKYKYKRALENHQLCWFCLQKVGPTMACCCDKTLRNIDTSNKKLSLISAFDKFCHVAEKPKRNFFESCPLVLTLRRDAIIVNDTDRYPVESEETYTSALIAHCVFLATRTKKCSKLYNAVEITVDFGEQPSDPDGLVDMLDRDLRKLLTQRIFISTPVQWSYFIA